MTPISACNAARRPGYSLLEVIAVVAIIAVAVTLSAPNMLRLMERQAAQGVVRSLDITVLQLRREALSSGRGYAHDETAARLQAGLEPGWRLALSRTVAFTAAGYCPGGTAELTSPEGRAYTVSLAEGACAIERR